MVPAVKAASGHSDMLVNRLEMVGMSSAKAIAKVGGLGMALGGMTSAAGTAILAAGSLSGLIMAWPAVMAAPRAALLTLRLGVDGFSDALAAIGEDPAKFNEAIKGLAPSAQETAKAIQGMKPAFDGLKLNIQETLFSDSATAVRSLGTVIDAVRQPMLGIAGSANTAGKEIAGLITSADGMSVITGFMQSVSDAMSRLGMAVIPVGQALLKVMGMGQTIIPQIAQWLGTAAERAAAWVSAASSSGELQQIWDRALQALGDIASIALDVGRLFGAIVSAAGGLGTPIGMVADAVKRVVDALISGGAANAVSGLFGGLQLAGQSLAQVLPQVVQAIAGLGPALGNILAAGGQALAGLLSTLSMIIIGLTPLITGLSIVLSAMGPAVGYVVTVILAVVAAVRAWVAVQAILNVLLTMNPIGLVVVALVALAAALAYAWANSTTFRNIVRGTLGAVASGFSALRDSASAALGWIKSKWQDLVGILRRLKPNFGGFWDSLKNSFRSVINSIIGKWNSLSFTIPSVDVPGLGSVGGASIGVPGIPYMARGGIVPRTGQVVVGERGPETVRLPGGSRVSPSAGGMSASGQPIVLEIRSGGARIDDMLVEILRKAVRVQGGNVQLVLGR
jgi:phage-related protein